MEIKWHKFDLALILGLDFTTHNDDTLRADEGQVQDDSKNNDITEEDDDCQYISVISNSIDDLYSLVEVNQALIAWSFGPCFNFS